MKIRVVVLLPDTINKFVVSVGRDLVRRFKHPNFFIVDDKKLIPHITLFETDIHPNRLLFYFEEIKKTLQKQPLFRLKISGYELEKEKGLWVALDVQDSKTLSRIRKGLFKKTKRLGFLVKIRRKFKPHITITKFKKIDPEVLKEIKTSYFGKTFSPSSISFCKRNKFSQVIKILKTFKLNG